MPNDERSTNDEILKQRFSARSTWAFELRHSFVIWHSSFVISPGRAISSRRSREWARFGPVSSFRFLRRKNNSKCLDSGYSGEYACSLEACDMSALQS